MRVFMFLPCESTWSRCPEDAMSFDIQSDDSVSFTETFSGESPNVAR